MRPLVELQRLEQRTLQATGSAPQFRPLGSDPGNHDYRPVVVRLKLNSGVAGDRTTPCSFTYDVWRAEATTAVINAPTSQQTTNFRLATAKTPVHRPIPLGIHIAAASGSFGLAVFDFSLGGLTLLMAFDERLDPGPC